MALGSSWLACGSERFHCGLCRLRRGPNCLGRTGAHDGGLSRASVCGSRLGRLFNDTITIIADYFNIGIVIVVLGILPGGGGRCGTRRTRGSRFGGCLRVAHELNFGIRIFGSKARLGLARCGGFLGRGSFLGR